MVFEILLISSLSVISTIIGVWWARFCSGRKTVVAGAVGFAAGVMLYLSIIELLVKSLQLVSWSMVIFWFLIGVMVLALIDWILPHIHHAWKVREGKQTLIKMAFLIAIGMIIHDFPEGFAIAGTYSLDESWGWLVGIGVALHNIPEELAIALPLFLTQQYKYLWILAIASALAEPLGALIGLGFSQSFASLLLPMTVFVGGAMTYIALHELVPFGLRIKPASRFVIGLILGIIVIAILASLF